MISENLYEIRWFRRKNWRQNISMVLTVMRGFPEKEHPKYDVPRMEKYYKFIGARRDGCTSSSKRSIMDETRNCS